MSQRQDIPKVTDPREIAREIAERTPMQVCAPFQVVDLRSGKVLMEVGATEAGPHLRFFNLQGGLMFELGCNYDGEGGSVRLPYSSGEAGVSFVVSNQTHEAMLFVQGDRQEGPSVSLGADRDGSNVELSEGASKFTRMSVGR